MTTLREAAQQALEALGLWATGRDMDAVALNDLIFRLEAALAEPVQEPEPGAYHGWVLREVLFDNGEPVGHREPVQEPVVNQQLTTEPVGVVTSMVKGGVTWRRWPADMPDGTKLYAAPPQRKPLTEEEVKAMWESHRAALPRYLCFARAIERAHGIGEQK